MYKFVRVCVKIIVLNFFTLNNRFSKTMNEKVNHVVSVEGQSKLYTKQHTYITK